MFSKKTKKLRPEYLERPGRTLSEHEARRLVAELRDCAATCFDDLPDYQCLREGAGALDDKVIALFRGERGEIAGFASALLLPVEGVGEVLHLGLTCVRPEYRGGGSTHKLLSRILTGYLLRHRLFGRVWISNVACVLSSLGNVADCFSEVHPSPGDSGAPSLTHLAIARAIDADFRDAIYIRPQAHFDPEHFVFRGSVRGTMFQKRSDDRRYHHRDRDLNAFYRMRMCFEDGDEVLQVGHASFAALLRYVVVQKLVAPRRRAGRPAPSAHVPVEQALERAA